MREHVCTRVEDFMFGHVLDCMNSETFHYVSGRIHILERRIRRYSTPVRLRIEYSE